MKAASQNIANDSAWKLLPLTPEYIEREHGSYVEAINAALENPNIHNIALSGNYGVGKSSILRRVTELHKNQVVELSLSTLAPIEEFRLDESVPKQATTPTNRIQQEIVKQLLYREEPNNTPGSRFRRIERFYWKRELAFSILVSLMITLIFLITGWTERFAIALTPLIDVGRWIHLIVPILGIGVTVAARNLFHGRIHIRQFSAGSATVTLDDKSVSYFDQYLDEIFYFFEVSKRDIVIFEDIDRFNDSRIFETLRSLNTLLNASPQFDKSIRFIYALKDSIFDRINLEQEGRRFEQGLLAIEDPAQTETLRANRTKFFDLVIPVVPFITHRSARNLTVQLMQEIEHKVDSSLTDLAVRYVPDMRLLKNVRNEFIVFRDRIFSGDGAKLNLSETDLFAMMLYKSTHLTDFEAIRIGTSNLDFLYKTSRKLVTDNIILLEREVRTIQQRLTRLDGVTTQSQRLGEQLITLVECTARATNYNVQHGQYSFADSIKTEEDLRNTKFWTEFIQASGEPKLLWSSSYQNRQRLSFTRQDLAKVLGDHLEPEDWNEANRKELRATLKKHRENLRFLRSADMSDLIKQTKFQVKYKGSILSLEDVTRDLLTTGLAYQLIRAGYINRNFTLYTSTFHGDRVSTAATNFIIHNVERDIMDEHFELDGNDVEAVIRERGKSALGEPALYNIAILDHLLSNEVRTTEADIMIRSLAELGDNQKRFMQAYLSNGNECDKFVRQFTAASSQVLTYLVTQVELEESTRIKLVSTTLASLVQDMEYRVDAAVSAYLEAHYAEFPALTSIALTHARAERIAAVFSKANTIVSDLTPLTKVVQQAFITNNLYIINRENLAIALGNDANLALDIAKKTGTGVYNYILENLDAYLPAIDGVSVTVDSEADFIPIIEDTLTANADRLRDIIAHSSTYCIVTNIEGVSKDAWPALAANERFPPTFSNVSHYIDSIGSIDANLAKILTSAQKITEHGTAEEEKKEQIATTILAARSELPSASLRAGLAASLDLSNYLGMDDIKPEKGELFGLLLEHNIVSDDAATYAHLSETDWATRERVIIKSKKFKDYMNPALVHADLETLLSSDKVNSAIKMAITDHASEYIEGCSTRALSQLAHFAIQNERQLTSDVVEKLASNGVAAKNIITLLKPHLDELSSELLCSILNSLEGSYPKLTSVGRDKPKIPNTLADQTLLEALKNHNIVSTYKAEGNMIKVNKKHT